MKNSLWSFLADLKYLWIILLFLVVFFLTVLFFGSYVAVVAAPDLSGGTSLLFLNVGCFVAGILFVLVSMFAVEILEKREIFLLSIISCVGCVLVGLPIYLSRVFCDFSDPLKTVLAGVFVFSLFVSSTAWNIWRYQKRQAQA